ncbi:MAG: hypothetical protein JXQ87_10825 [Bacteroidia bacterium]
MKEPTETIVCSDFQIKLFDENDYKLDSEDNWISYDKTFLNEDDYSPTSLIGIQLARDTVILKSFLIGASGGGTGLHKHSFTVNGSLLSICCSNSVFCFDLPKLNLNWVTKADGATCFGIYSYKDNFIVHGELQVTRLSNQGKILWQQSGKDIFTTVEGDTVFTINEEHILVKDWENNVYKIGFDGKFID